ncbi:MAG TPA: T9SS type A sorting domain-containing protein [Saprospiraceae bacterium]
MNSFTSKIAIVAFILSHVYHLHAHVALDYPQGGETFIVGETITIQWHIVVPHNQQNWDLFVSPDGGVTWDTLQLDIPTSTMSYEWVIPNIITSQARIQIFQDNEDQNYLDNSMDFTIAPNTNPPLLDAPANDIFIECSIIDQETAIQAWLNTNGGAAVTNYCGELVWTNDYPGLSNGCAATGVAVVTFTATDECGSTMTIATLTVDDTQPPQFLIQPSTMTVETDGQGNPAALNSWLITHGGAIATDACGQVTWSHDFTGFSDGCGITGEAIVHFSAIDGCGNMSTALASFIIEDHVSPDIVSSAQPLTIACSANDPQVEIDAWLNNHGGATATDVGGGLNWTHNYSGLSDGCGATGNATVTFTVQDACGNTTLTSATIMIEDLVAPLIVLAAQYDTIECSAPSPQDDIQNWLSLHGGAQASDGCSEVTWTRDFKDLFDYCGGTAKARYIFIATDACGNSSTTEAVITIEDNTSPVMHTLAQDTTIVCGQSNAPTAIQGWLDRKGGAGASDLCGEVSWTHDFPELTDTCVSEGIYDITFTAIDECGNTNSTHALLTITDSLATSISGPSDFGFTIYPNPASDYITISFNQIEVNQVHLMLWDAYGKVIWSGDRATKEIQIPVNNYPNGMYFLQVSTMEGIFSKRVIIH